MLFSKQSSEERREMILNGNILTTLLFLSVPTLMVGIIQALIPLSDGLFLNNLGGVLVASSVSFSQPILNTMIALSQGLGAAAMAMIRKLYGRGIIRAVKETTLQIFVFSFFIGLGLIPVCIILAFFIAEYTTPEIKNNVFIYISLYSLVIPFNFLASIYNAVKNSIGRPEVPLIRIFILIILKIIFNTVFLYFFKLKIFGAVIATFCSYVVVTIWMYHDLFIKKDDMRLEIKKYKFIPPIVKKLLRIGFPSMISYMLIQLGFFLINTEVEKYGAISLNAQGIASNINSICFILPASIGITVTSMVSMNMGIGNIKKSKKIFYCGIATSIVIAILIIALILPLDEILTLSFTREKAVLEIANKALNIYTYSVISFGIFCVCQGVFIALGRTKVPMFMSVLRIWFFRYLFILFTKSFLGVYSVFWGNLFSNMCAGILFFILVLKINWSNKNV